MKDALFIFLQKVAPQKLLSRIAGKFADTKTVWLKNLFIRWFTKKYQVDLGEAEFNSAEDYADFNTFFTRALLPNARQICVKKGSVVCPADGEISQIGNIDTDLIFQAKGHQYSLQSLLAGDSTLADKFKNGKFATIYLSPRDYHRVHMPVDGVLEAMLHVPGDLFSVNKLTASKVPNLFARNERMIAIFETETGPLAVIMVGAMIVASIETVWAGLVNTQKSTVSHYCYRNDDEIQLGKGLELGRFKLGSTVILLLPENTASWSEHLQADSKVQMGQQIAEIIG